MKKLILLPMPTAHFTWQKQIIAASILLTFCSCTKDPVANKRGTVHNEFTVVEINSDRPIPGVSVKAYGSVTGTLYTATTNDSGKVSFDSQYGIVSLKINQDKYWPYDNDWAWSFTTPPIRAELTPIATLKVRLTRVNQYPSGLMLNMWVPGGNNGIYNDIKQLFSPRDGIIYFNGKGNCGNSIGWSVDATTQQNATPVVVVNRFDTAEFEIKY